MDDAGFPKRPPGGPDGTLRPGEEGLHPRPGDDVAETPAPAPSPLVATPPSLRFRDAGEIARSGMGSVRRAYDTLLRREVAMKVSRPSDPSHAHAALRIVEEAQITGQLDHPNIVAVHDVGTGLDGGGVYFTMKLVEGDTLTAIIERLHQAPYDHRAIERVIQIVLKICDALSFAHSRGVVHRDLKPDNVMVGSHGQVYLMDWGVALLAGSASDRPEAMVGAPHVTLSDGLSRDAREEAGAIVGTYEYMAPEQAWGRSAEVDARTDVFGLGALLYHLLMGHGPNAAANAFESLQRAQRGQPEPPTNPSWGALPPGLWRIAQKAMSRERAARHASVAELEEELEDFLRGGGWFDTRVYPAGASIVTQGDAAAAAYIIVSGTCEVFKVAGDERVVLRRLGPGDVFGETAVLTGEPRTASVAAVEPVEVKIVTRDALERELGRGSWAGTFVKALADRFRDVDEQLGRLRDKIR